MDSNRSFYTTEIVLSSLFVLSWAFGFSREFTNNCFSVTFWVFGALLLQFLRALCICCKGSIGGDHGAPLLGMIIIWSVLGNIIIGTSIRCAPFNTPIMFYTSIGYIGIVDLFILVWLVANCTKGPNAARQHPMTTSTTLTSSSDNTDLTAEQSKYWSWWLVYYGCAEVECCPPQLATVADNTRIDDPSLISSPYSASETSVSTPASVSVSVHCTESVCSICLAPLLTHSVVASNNNCYSLLESGGILTATASVSSSTTHTTTNLVARFPCTGGHYFHSACLKRWLEAASSMDVECAENNKQVTCPNCREKPRIIC